MIALMRNAIFLSDLSEHFVRTSRIEGPVLACRSSAVLEVNPQERQFFWDSAVVSK
jgi:hypothetical protein